MKLFANLSTKLLSVAKISSLALFFFSALGSLNLAHAGDVVASGQFAGASNHDTSGGVSLVKSGSGFEVVLASNFSFDGAPDPKVGFGKGGKYDLGSTLSPLRSNSGKQSYAVPASLSVDGYDEIYIWCEKYSVPLGVAKIR